jgi:hypothetical protein
MTETIQRKLSDSAFARWTALILIASTMFFGYMFVDVLSPLQYMLETTRGWSPTVFGLYGGSEFILNVCGFLLLAGIILDKMGVRFTGILSASLMVVGAGIKLYGISDYFAGGGFGHAFLSSFLQDIPASAKLACLGFMVFGCGTEMAGITVSKAIVKWFTGKELALAMGLEMAIARLGVFAVFSLSPWIADLGTPSIVRPVAVVGILLCIGLLTFITYAFMDRKLDRQIGAMSTGEPEEQFKVSDLGKLFTSRTFLMVAILCVLYYSAIFPFQKFATGMLETNLGISTQQASDIFRWFPIGAMLLTPFLGAFLDHKGKGASMLMLGAVLMFVCHMIFALVPLTPVIAYGAIVILGISFSLVPAALWPSVPKLVANRYLGSAYSVIFWIQNIGLMAFPIIIGFSLNISNPGVSENLQGLQNRIDVLTEDYKAYTTAYDIYNAVECEAVLNPAATDSLTFVNHPDAEPQFGEIIVTLDKVFAHIGQLKNPEKRAEISNGLLAELNKIDLSRAPEELRAPLDNIKREMEQIRAYDRDTVYNYRQPMLIFACLGVLAFLLAFWLKREDARKHYGLELPNIETK